MFDSKTTVSGTVESDTTAVEITGAEDGDGIIWITIVSESRTVTSGILESAAGEIPVFDEEDAEEANCSSMLFSFNLGEGLELLLTRAAGDVEKFAPGMES